MCPLRADLSVDSLAKFVALFAPRGELATGQLQWYRGDGLLRVRTPLLPSIARAPSRLSEEWLIYQRFQQNAAAYLPHRNLTSWDWMLYMRHYGAMTRLLDWTESPLVALYFAVEKSRRDKNDGVVWCLDPLALNKHAGLEPRIYCGGIDQELDPYLPAAVKAAPITTENQPVALIAHRSFQRLIAQQGVFTLIHRAQISLEKIDDGGLLARIRIPARAKARIRKSLAALGVNQLSLYPELQSVPGAG
jgi:hypothetical protein